MTPRPTPEAVSVPLVLGSSAPGEGSSPGALRYRGPAAFSQPSSLLGRECLLKDGQVPAYLLTIALPLFFRQLLVGSRHLS